MLSVAGRRRVTGPLDLTLRAFRSYSTTPAVSVLLDGTSFFDTTHLSSSIKASIQPSDFELYPNFLSGTEQKVLLSSTLKKLDSVRSISRELRNKRKDRLSRRLTPPGADDELEQQFLPDELYGFEEVSTEE
jgi:hypothetical protein